MSIIHKAIKKIFDPKPSPGRKTPARRKRAPSVKSAPRRKPPQKPKRMTLQQALKIPRENGMRENVQYISLKQPWAWLVLMGHKDIENRGRVSHFRGELFIHASSNQQKLKEDLKYIQKKYDIEVPVKELKFGSILGSVLMLNCVKSHKSRYFSGPFGYVICEPRWIKPIKYKANAGMQKAPDVKIQYLTTDRP